MLTSLFSFLCRFAPLKRLLWRRWYQYLAKRYQIPEWQVMNYGYSELPVPAPIALGVGDEPERYGLQLYHRVASAVPLAGRTVLEVGCGRGGGAAHVHRALQPASMTAVDFSQNAIELCQRRYAGEGAQGLTFRHGDAEALPFPDASFEAVINVESSHCYGSIETFFREVRRVLTPGGHFLYTDFRDTPKVAAWRAALLASGLRMVEEANITANVLSALDADTERRVALVRTHLPKRIQAAASDFAAVQGSSVYEDFRAGRMQYWRFVLVKAEG